MNVKWIDLCSIGFVALALSVSGCGEQPTAAPAGADKGKPAGGTEVAAHDDHDHDHGDKKHTHDGWWCDEHGVPEHQCAQCNSKIAAEFKREGDWCEKHDRPDSQCFICHPEFEGKFAKLYEAKYDKKPPKRAAEKDAAEKEGAEKETDKPAEETK